MKSMESIWVRGSTSYSFHSFDSKFHINVIEMYTDILSILSYEEYTYCEYNTFLL